MLLPLNQLKAVFIAPDTVLDYSNTSFREIRRL